MPFAIHSFLFALNALTFIALSDFSRPIPFALASPLSVSLPIARSTDYLPEASDSPFQSTNPRPAVVSVSRPVVSRIERLQNRKTNDHLLALKKYQHKANANAGNLKNLAARSSTVAENDHKFQQDCVSQLTEFNTNVLGFQSILSELSSRKGLAFYDHTNDLETLLKDLVNTNKSALDAITKIVNNIPILGPILGPIVYELKCILDEVLNLCENLTDLVINLLQPLLRSLLGTPPPDCNGVVIVGLCI